jgi:hypothetical protein
MVLRYLAKVANAALPHKIDERPQSLAMGRLRAIAAGTKAFIECRSHGKLQSLSETEISTTADLGHGDTSLELRMLSLESLAPRQSALPQKDVQC